MLPWPPDVWVLIPAYRSAHLLERLLHDLLQYVPPGRIVVVDDASHDETPGVCAGFGITCLSHDDNRGKGAALATGFGHCIAGGSRWIITMDADGQHSTGDLGKFIAASRESPAPGICIGARSMTPGVMPLDRILSNRITSGILSLFCGIPIIDSQCGFRCYSARLLERISIEYNRFEMESEIIMKAAFLGFPVTFTTIQTVYLNGPSHISHFSDTLRWIAAVVRIRLRRESIIRSFS